MPVGMPVGMPAGMRSEPNHTQRRDRRRAAPAAGVVAAVFAAVFAAGAIDEREGHASQRAEMRAARPNPQSSARVGREKRGQRIEKSERSDLRRRERERERERKTRMARAV
jgi:hypothetical protein